MKVEQYTCDVCGKVRGEGNHWLKGHSEDGVCGPVFEKWSDTSTAISPKLDICSAACAHKALDEWLTKVYKEAHQ